MTIRSALCLAAGLLLLGVGPVTWAQDEAAEPLDPYGWVDEPYRDYDVLYPTSGSPMQGRVMERGSDGSVEFRNDRNIQIRYKRDEYTRVEERETPLSAFGTRAQRIEREVPAGDRPAVHRRLAEWGIAQAEVALDPPQPEDPDADPVEPDERTAERLLAGAKRELQQAAEGSDAPETWAASVEHRERWIDLIRRPLAEIPPDATSEREPILEEVLDQVAAGRKTLQAAGKEASDAPVLTLIEAKVLLELGLEDQAEPLLEQVRVGLEELAKRPPPEPAGEQGGDGDDGEEPAGPTLAERVASETVASYRVVDASLKQALEELAKRSGIQIELTTRGESYAGEDLEITLDEQDATVAELLDKLKELKNGLRWEVQEPLGEEDEGQVEFDGADPGVRKMPGSGERRFGRDGARGGPGGANNPGGGQGPAGPEPIDNTAQELPGLEPSRYDDYQEVYRTLAELALKRGDEAQAESLHRRVLVTWPQNEGACLGLAKILAGRGEVEGALMAIQEALAVAGDDPQLLLAKGQLMLQKGDPQAAVLDLDKAVNGASGAEQERAACSLVLAFLMSKQDAKAAALLGQYDRPEAGGWVRYAQGLYEEWNSRLDEAKTRYEEAAAAFGKSQQGPARYALGQALLAASDVSGAERELRAAAASGLPVKLALKALSDVAARRDATEEARLNELIYRLSSDPSPDELANLARTRLIEQRLDDAADLFQRALGKAPDHRPSLRGLAYCAYTQGDYREAEKLFARLLKLNKDDAWALRGQRYLREAQTRYLWVDEFSGEALDNTWGVRQEDFGARASVADGVLVIKGVQKNKEGDDSETTIGRAIEDEEIVRLEALIELKRGERAGIQLLKGRGAGLRFWLEEQSGQLQLFKSSKGRSGWSDPEALGNVSAGPKRLAIDISDRAKGLVTFLVDGNPLGEPQSVRAFVSGGRVRRLADFTLGVFARGAALGDDIEVTADGIYVYAYRGR